MGADYPVLRGISLTGFGGRPRVDEELAQSIRDEATRILADCARKDAALRKLCDLLDSWWYEADPDAGYADSVKKGDPHPWTIETGARAALAEAEPAAGEPELRYKSEREAYWALWRDPAPEPQREEE